MRLGVFLLFFAIILATVSPPVAAQLSPPGPPDVEKPVKKGKPPKKAKEPPPGDEEGDPDGEEGEPDGEEGNPDGEEGDPDGEEGEPDGEEGEPDGAEGDPGGGEGDPGDRESGSPESGDHSGPGGEGITRISSIGTWRARLAVRKTALRRQPLPTASKETRPSAQPTPNWQARSRTMAFTSTQPRTPASPFLRCSLSWGSACSSVSPAACERFTVASPATANRNRRPSS